MSESYMNRIGIQTNKNGFTLLEALIAMFVFSIGILATVSMQTSSIYGNRTAQDITEAATIATNQIEIMRSWDYNQDARLSDGAHPVVTENQYSISYNVQRDAIIANTMLIQMAVTWMDRNVSKNVNFDYILLDII